MAATSDLIFHRFLPVAILLSLAGCAVPTSPPPQPGLAAATQPLKLASNYDRPGTSSSGNGIHLWYSGSFRSAKNKQELLDLIAKI